MCGLAGFLCAPAAFNEDSVEQIIAAMTAAIRWRGPDSFGAWSDPAAGIALGHARLSIVDLSTAGQQPMTSASGRYVVAYNGEIYNHADLRARLEERGSAPPWRGHSDTETLVAGLDAWGVHSTIEQLVGMFAIAIWDRHKRKLLLVRDRLGEKPLCFGWQGRGATRSFIFGSELFALEAHPSFDSGVNRDSLVQMLRYGHVGEDNSIREGVSKVKPGEIVEISLDHPDPVCRSYWDGGSLAATASEQDSSHLSASAAVDQLEALLLDTVSRQMMSDVALGAFLSGGIDSSMIVALMQRHSDRAIHTFSIGFQEERYNEAEFAKAVAQHIGTKHTELYVGEAELLNVVPKLADIYDEPFADSSQIPTYLVAKLARNDVTVALSGDGGDELFCGYPRYLHGNWLVGRMGNFPHAVRAAASAISHQLPRRLLNSVVEPFSAHSFGKGDARTTDSENWRLRRKSKRGGSTP